jgi:hypothetical protein
MILYHGEEKWSIGTNFASMYGDIPEVLKPYVPDFKYMLMDLSDFVDNRIMGEYVWNAVLMLFKYVSGPEYADKIPEILKSLHNEFNKDNGFRILETLLRYIYSTVNKGAVEYKEVIKKALPKDKEGVIMTLADMFINEGRSEGIRIGEERGEQRGEQRGLHKALMTAISSRFDDLPNDIALKIEKINDEESLLSLTQEAVKCNDLGEYRNFLKRI